MGSSTSRSYYLVKTSTGAGEEHRVELVERSVEIPWAQPTSGNLGSIKTKKTLVYTHVPDSPKVTISGQVGNKWGLDTTSTEVKVTYRHGLKTWKFPVAALGRSTALDHTGIWSWYLSLFCIAMACAVGIFGLTCGIVPAVYTLGRHHDHPQVVQTTEAIDKMVEIVKNTLWAEPPPKQQQERALATSGLLLNGDFLKPGEHLCMSKDCRQYYSLDTDCRVACIATLASGLHIKTYVPSISPKVRDGEKCWMQLTGGDLNILVKPDKFTTIVWSTYDGGCTQLEATWEGLRVECNSGDKFYPVVVE